MKSKQKILEIFPYGMAFSADQSRPIMVFKTNDESRVLPVWLSPLDVGITLHQNTVEMGYSVSPFTLTWKILQPLGIHLQKCCFTDLKGHHQYVDLHFKGHPQLEVLNVRADEAVSFCLSVKTQFYCSADYFDKCRLIDAEMLSMGLDLKKYPQRFKNNHPYLN